MKSCHGGETIQSKGHLLLYLSLTPMKLMLTYERIIIVNIWIFIRTTTIPLDVDEINTNKPWIQVVKASFLSVHRGILVFRSIQIFLVNWTAIGYPGGHELSRSRKKWMGFKYMCMALRFSLTGYHTFGYVHWRI